MSDERDDFSPFDQADGSGIEGYVLDDSGGEPRLHGYALGSDLATHYDYSEVQYLAFCGEFPSPAQRKMFDVAMLGAMRITVGDASVHGARMARHLAYAAGTPGSVVCAAAVGVAEMTRTEVEEHGSLLAWLGTPDGPMPVVALSADPDPFVAAMRTALDDELGLGPMLDAGPTSLATVIAMFWTCGLRDLYQIAGAITSARIPIALAEAYGTPDPRLWAYPLNLPFWDYQHQRGTDD